MKSLLRLSIVIAALLQLPQPALAQQREPLDSDTLDAIAAYCSEYYAENFDSYDACTLYENRNYVPTGQEYQKDYLMKLPFGGYITYHYTLGG